MSLKSFVLISSINNLSDARYCAGMGVDAIGFQLNPQDDDFVAQDKFEAIAGWVSGVSLVGEFNNADIDVINEVIENYKLDFIQTQRSDLLNDLKKLAIPVILKIVIENHEDLEDIKTIMNLTSGMVEFYLLERNGSVDAEIAGNFILQLADEFPIVLGFGINPENALQLSDSSLKGIALKGGNELKPGFKDYDELADILEELEED